MAIDLNDLSAGLSQAVDVYRTGRGVAVEGVMRSDAKRFPGFAGGAPVAYRITSMEHPEDGLIVLGDFNAPRFFRPVRIVASAGLTVAESRGSTFHFNRGITVLPAIDHVLSSKAFAYKSTRVIRDRINGQWPSDHFPLFVTLSFSPGR